MQLGGDPIAGALSGIANQAIAGGNTYEGKQYVDTAAQLAGLIPGVGTAVGAGINLASGAIARFGGTNPEEEHRKKIRELAYQATQNKSDAILAENFEGRKSGLPTTKGLTRTYEYGGVMAQAMNRRNKGMSVIPKMRGGGSMRRKRRGGMMNKNMMMDTSMYQMGGPMKRGMMMDDMYQMGGMMKGRKKRGGMKRMKMMYKYGGAMNKKMGKGGMMEMTMKMKKKKYRKGGMMKKSMMSYGN